MESVSETSLNVLGRHSALNADLLFTLALCHVCAGEEMRVGLRGQDSARCSLRLRGDPTMPTQTLVWSRVSGGQFLPGVKGWIEGVYVASLSSFFLPLASKPMSFPSGSFSGLCST